ncbi:hypothetical protein [Citricoccus sp. K5]|uniref:hypothetical protein n=1 Tax=Citricoccus sp. K5 TaxID=2653135 RepID=UPI0012EFFDED|nr:hypothetical protein [Citricoccus sp. K5]VXB23738.1 hypothetical protein CITRIK5_30013 [Citricoccus sp. K5]
MSKSITEKEYSQILENIGVANSTEAARLLVKNGHLTCAPEKPEPGTWHVVKDGDYEGYPARVFHRQELHIFSPMGSVIAITRPNEWPDLDPATPPARVVAAEPVELSEADVQKIHNEHPIGNYFEDLAKVDRASIVRTVNAARRNLLEASK